jgi:hypothetical protein
MKKSKTKIPIPDRDMLDPECANNRYGIYCMYLSLMQEKYCRQLLAYHEVLDPGKTQIKNKLLLELRKASYPHLKYLEYTI